MHGRLLVVEDEPSIRELLAASLRFNGFAVDTAATGGEALRHVEKEPPDLILLDVMLPDRDGFDVLRWLRAGGQTIPVLFLTARDASEDKITGLTIGGDDYITKPFSLEEVIARVHAVLRRTKPPREPAEPLSYADLELDVDSHRVRRAGRVVELSPTEFKLLHYLLRNAGRVLSKAQILDQVWHYDFNGEVGVVESYISYLRRKVDDVEPRLIHTVRGIGYVLRRPS
ncbi:response regulator transcription factor [Actinosynnema sp. NPDC020468]|uniref:response regulator transcription factor n=1 Tax=Actinosynnema sp. NPDC020468 TaxID=3154488 RepID=UPI0033C5D6AC